MYQNLFIMLDYFIVSYILYVMYIAEMKHMCIFPVKVSN